MATGGALSTRAGPVFDAAFQARLVELFRWRRDVRRFQATAVAPALIEGLLAAAWLAPSVGYSQPWRFVTVDDAPRRAAIRANFAACNARALAGQDTDRAAASARLWLAARAAGLGMGWVSILDPAVVAAVLDVPARWLFVGYFCLGYPETEDDAPELQRAGWEEAGTVAVIRR
jgi:5,6-dimethylbenzimidazole synthase